MFSQLTIRTKLTALLVVFGVGLAALGIYAYVTLSAVKVNGPHYAAIVQGKDLIADILPPPEYIIETHLVAHTMMQDEAGKDLADTLDRYAQLKQDYGDRHAFWIKDLDDGEMKNVLIHDSFRPAEKYYQLMDSDFIPAIRSGDRPKAAATLAELSKLYAEHRAAIDRVVGLATGRNAAKEKEVSALIASRTLVLVVLGLAALGFGIFWSLLTARSILSPLQQTIDVMHRVAGGDLTLRLDADRGDELGQMSSSINHFLGTLQTMLQETCVAAARVAEGAEQVSASAEQLSSGAQEQASSLEETAATMEEITATVTQSADNARQAAQYATTSRDVAEKGGRVVEEAVEAMGQINRSSKKIADIITAIDEIAFQTNLLALNAAVEAARAGDQGRGFAVVAGEVRNLAGRSAQAARETKTLIQESLGFVESGTNLVNQSGNRLQEIVRSVKRVTDIVTEIAAASREQSNGIDQVNKAIGQVDTVTQGGASRSEELSGTADALSRQSSDLLALVSRFKLSDEANGDLRVQARARREKPAPSARPRRDPNPRPGAPPRAAAARSTTSPPRTTPPGDRQPAARHSIAADEPVVGRSPGAEGHSRRTREREPAAIPVPRESNVDPAEHPMDEAMSAAASGANGSEGHDRFEEV